MADFPTSAVDYLDTEIYEFGASFGPAQLDYIDFGATSAPPVIVIVQPPPAPAPPTSTVRYVSTLDGETDEDFGSDVLVFPGVDPDLNLSTGGRVLAEAIARRLSTPRGSLPFHEEYGFDLRSYLNEAMTSDQLYRLKSSVERECEADERVESASVDLTFTPEAHALKVRIELVTATGPFRFTLAVSQVSVELLSEA